ncbi:hypothetical protein [Streptomyces johnsoniae]|uniref:Uncharacterized protein n=1 Tax=Streptomyces johnsoniae TaxID=3075532 RepID=A0ABU2SCK6_9ACTN|nr:hypothetical protein [Streptomyces sp. DSM 41886]MDT0446708.1 hypothetical protein [Streptomyces sp. DSM 41886]
MAPDDRQVAETGQQQGQQGQQHGYFLVTTVHVRNPEFETLTATTGVSTSAGRRYSEQGPRRLPVPPC